mmetsp:Transcript_4575/g.12931  ORF Transcript_4575/g.12931 Transcript_4575/m.12931 type:complete len:1028 (+) Transcript_4575:353-3436(+)|eukprot:CAMPEP_0181057516 /NCGR_PEP_ID=MMETSP1070-20121207/20292_1 /TAXON_ID=265543 /ORGANISM="Minutocellus polymorphus, Strain NH13" /LENGTH=1027 /DNA_ID=CAMNT_0023136935 /DNA_START=260 /DNA_END=3343 /DNA_ORIENTATION=-
MTSGKQEFDPRIHLKNDGGDDDDDDRKPSARSLSGGNGGSRHADGRPLRPRGHHYRGSYASEDTKEEITDGIQSLSYDDLPLGDTIVTAAAAAPAQADDDDDDDEDPDEVLARRLQEEMEREDRLASQNRHRQMEAEDAALARRLMEQGSVRNLGGGGGPDLSALPEEGIGGAVASDANDASLELARQLQREQASGPIGGADEALARQLFEESLVNLTGGEDLRRYAASSSGGGSGSRGSSRGGHHGGREMGTRNSSELPAIPGESDEELARRYFQQSMRGFAANDDGSGASDEALARQLQEQQLRSATSASRPAARGPNSASMQDEDEALARRLMEEGLNELRSGQANAIATLSRDPSANVDEDMELARRMQNMEGIGSGPADATGAGGRSSSSDYDRLARLRQEQEDEILARQFIQDTGDRSRPGIRQVNTPARLAPQAAVTRVGNAGPRPIPPPGPLPPQHGASPRSSSTIPRPTGPPRDAPIQSAVPVEISLAPIVDHAPAEILPGNETDNHRNKRGSLFNKLKGGRGRRGSGGGGGGGPNAGGPLAIPPPPSPPRGASDTHSRPGPFPHSVSISQLLPIASNPYQQGRASGTGNRASVPHAAASSPAGGSSGRKSSSGSAPSCCACHKPAPSYLSTLDKKYHPECFRCMGCHEPIDHSSPFAYTVGDGGEKHPLHRKCYAELFGIKCAVCRRSIPTGADGKVSYVKHPFFDKERMCPRHAQNPTPRRCTGCHRFEPEGDGFADLGDAGRCVCMSCCRSVIVDSVDAKPLWDLVVRFFEDILGLTLWGTMRDTPVLVVGFDALNDQLQSAGGAHSGSSQIMTRGLCLSEHQSGRRIAVQRLHYDQGSGKFCADDVEERGFALFQVPDPTKTNPNSSVTAILCLSGLPSDLTASILAHEATHAWIKLHPNFDVRRPIPLQVEEGCCQLMAYLFLQYLDTVKAEEEASSSRPSAAAAATDAAQASSKDAVGPTDEKLRQYFKFSIETDESDAYGIGYRAAAKAYAAIGIEALLNFVITYRKFPDV